MSTALEGGERLSAGTDERAAGIVCSLVPESLLGRFNRAGVLAPADVHAATTLARLVGETDELAVLGAAFAVRAPRVGHVYVDLAAVRASASSGEEDESDEAALDELPWPDVERWVTALASSALVTRDPGSDPDRPLVLEDVALYLDRLWRDEIAVATAITARAGRAAEPDAATVAQSVQRFVPELGSDGQRRAAATVIGRRLAVIAGGPGTGKTTTVARVLAALFDDAGRTAARPPLAALAAPTGKAAARLAEAVRAETAGLGLDDGVRGRLDSLEAFTVHRLLGSIPGVSTRFRHHAGNRLPHDLVVVDEASMLPLWLMARLVEAVRDDARLVLVGDPEQLASVEAGVVLADIVGPARRAPETPGAPAPEGIAGCVVTLSANYRFRGALAELAEAVRAGAVDRTLAVLGEGTPELEWIDAPPDRPGAAADVVEVVAGRSLAHLRGLVEAARDGGPEAALQEVERFRVLCAHRRGPFGASTWNERIERLAGSERELGAGSSFSVGRPLIVTANDYALRLFNGDVGVVVAREDGGVNVAFRRGAELYLVSPVALTAFANVYAMTIHKSQGSEFDEVTVVLPEPTSRVLTRELLYTAITRARKKVCLVGSAEALQAAIERPVTRASGLMRRLWGP